MDVKEELLKLIRATVQLAPDVMELIVEHLMSPDVGVSEPGLICHITEEDIQHVGKVPKRALLKAFQSYGMANRSEPSVGILHNPGTSNSLQDHQQMVLASTSTRHLPVDRGQTDTSIHQGCPSFKYHVEWGELPLSLLRSLNKAEVEKKSAHPEDRRKLKLAIAEQLLATYRNYMDMNPSVKFKTPGLKVYQDVKDEVFQKYKFCLQDFINNQPKADGKDTFLTVFKICVDNKCRNKTRLPRPMKKAAHGRGVVGVLSPEAYQPLITQEDEDVQLLMKEELKEIHMGRKSDWNIATISRNMHNSYALQRKEIVVCFEKIKEKQIENQENDDPDDTMDEGIYPYVQHLQRQWPFLFELPWLETHFQLLMGHLLHVPMEEYALHHLDHMITYLTSSGSSSTVKNIAMNLKWETSGKNPSLKMLIFICMVSNYFNEDFKVFIKTVEKTTRPEEVKWAVQGLTGDPCLVILDDNMYMATHCLPCMDQVSLAPEPVSFEDGLITFFAMIFILDAEYPVQAPNTMEFFERVVFGLALDKSKVARKKNALSVLLLSPTVARLVNNAKQFVEQLEDMIE